MLSYVQDLGDVANADLLPSTLILSTNIDSGCTCSLVVFEFEIIIIWHINAKLAIE